VARIRTFRNRSAAERRNPAGEQWLRKVFTQLPSVKRATGIDCADSPKRVPEVVGGLCFTPLGGG
jgi:hypothetical protein